MTWGFVYCWNFEELGLTWTLLSFHITSNEKQFVGRSFLPTNSSKCFDTYGEGRGEWDWIERDVTRDKSWFLVLLCRCIEPEVLRPEPWGPILSPLLGDTADYGVRLSYRAPAYVAWWTGTTTCNAEVGLLPKSGTKNTAACLGLPPSIRSHSSLCIATQITLLVRKKLGFHYREPRYRDIKNSSAKTYLFNIWTNIGAMDRTPIAQYFFKIRPQDSDQRTSG